MELSEDGMRGDREETPDTPETPRTPDPRPGEEGTSRGVHADTTAQTIMIQIHMDML